jgi:histo-blood group ABO system transferase
LKAYSKSAIVFFIACTLYCQGIFSENVGLMVMATGKYISFVNPLIKSAKQYFCKNHNVTFFVFTDREYPPEDNVVVLYQPRLGWPYDTMMRFQVYASHKDILSQQDYLFACDADMLFVGEVGDEILSERTATLHPGFYETKRNFFSYDTNPNCKAYIAPHEGQYYFAGGFYGGSAEEVIKICETNANNIQTDLDNNLIAVWHDESHWNRYCIDHPPTLILSPSYCYPEHLVLPFERKLLALFKNHSQWRE